MREERTDREHGNRIFSCWDSWTKLDNYKKICYNKKKDFCADRPQFPGNFERICPDRFHPKKLPYARTDRKLGLARSRPALSTGSVAIWTCVAHPPSQRGLEQMFGAMRTNVRILGKIWKRAFIIYLQKIFLNHLTLWKFRLVRPLSAGRFRHLSNIAFRQLPQMRKHPVGCF